MTYNKFDELVKKMVEEERAIGKMKGIEYTHEEEKGSLL